jgi:hypothetical protein
LCEISRSFSAEGIVLALGRRHTGNDPPFWRTRHDSNV